MNEYISTSLYGLNGALEIALPACILRFCGGIAVNRELVPPTACLDEPTPSICSHVLFPTVLKFGQNEQYIGMEAQQLRLGNMTLK